MGLDDDQEQALEFADVDIYMGGHHHVAIDPPLVITNEEQANVSLLFTLVRLQSLLVAWMLLFEMVKFFLTNTN